MATNVILARFLRNMGRIVPLLRKVECKEANKTLYWLDLLQQSEYITEQSFKSTQANSEELVKLLATHRQDHPGKYASQIATLNPHFSLHTINFQLLTVV